MPHRPSSSLRAASTTAGAALEFPEAIFPDSLLDEPPESEAERSWWVLYTKARHEKAVAESLSAGGVPYYLPLLRKESLYRGRRVSSIVPVFSSYLFLYGDSDERVKALATNRVSRTLLVADGDGLIRDLRHLRKLIAHGAPLMVEQRLAPGRKVRVKGGPLAGLEGQVLRRKQKTRLVVAVNYLQQGASVEIEDCLLEPC
jgi:transcriptional antiterminator RfaH